MSQIARTLVLAAALVAPAFVAPVFGSAQERPAVERTERGPRGNGERGFRSERGERGLRGEHRFARIAQALSLTDAQVAQLRSVMEEARAERPRGEARPSRDERRAHHAALRARIDAILTPAQRAVVAELRQARRDAHEARGERGRRGQSGRFSSGIDSRGI